MPDRPTFDYEQQYWAEGIELIAGVDEVGMGALAGPVVAAAVVFSSSEIQMSESKDQIRSKIRMSKTRIRDSKQMTERQREEVAEEIKQSAVTWAVGEASVDEIAQLNIRGASHLAMRRAVDGLGVEPELLLIDGLPAQPHGRIPAASIVKGDQISYSIAAASIVAKVHRDAIMQRLAAKHPDYLWESNKGYGSAVHREALVRHGATEHHRAAYAPVAAVRDRS